MNKQPTITLLENLYGQSKEYVKNRFDLYKLKAVDKTASVITAIALGVALFVVFFIFFVVLNIGIALLIGDLVGRAYLGFLIWAAVYAIVGLVLFFARDKVFKSPITGLIFRKFL
jgi:hypothetical protein